jgi:hypothetical protein
MSCQNPTISEGVKEIATKKIPVKMPKLDPIKLNSFILLKLLKKLKNAI